MRAHWLSLMVGTAALCFGFSAAAAPATQPRSRALQVPAGWEILNDVEFGKGGDLPLTLVIAKPQQKPPKPLPLIIHIHGGGWRDGKAGARSFNLTHQGYVVASVNYRLTGVAAFPAQVHDVKAALRFLRAHAGEYFFNPNRVGVRGESAGAHLALMLGTSADVKQLEGDGGSPGVSTRVQAVVNFYGPTDLRPEVSKPVSTPHVTWLLGGTPAEKPDLAALASPVFHVTRDDAPVFTAHGETDTTVPIEQAERLDAALKRAGVEHVMHRFAGIGHVFRATTTQPNGTPAKEVDQSIVESMEAQCIAFFDKHLKGLATRPATSRRPR